MWYIYTTLDHMTFERTNQNETSLVQPSYLQQKLVLSQMYHYKIGPLKIRVMANKDLYKPLYPVHLFSIHSRSYTISYSI